MKIVFDEFNKIKQLDKKYDKLTGSDNTEKKTKLGDKITSLRNTIVTEFDDRKARWDEDYNSHLDNEVNDKDTNRANKLDERKGHLDQRLADLDALLDPSLIHVIGDGPTQPNTDEANSTSKGYGKGKSTESHHKDKAERQADREERKANRKSEA